MKNIFITGLCIIYIVAITGCCSVSIPTSTDTDTDTAVDSNSNSDNVESTKAVESIKQKTESELEKAMTLIDGITTFIITTIYYK